MLNKIGAAAKEVAARICKYPLGSGALIGVGIVLANTLPEQLPKSSQDVAKMLVTSGLAMGAVILGKYSELTYGDPRTIRWLIGACTGVIIGIATITASKAVIANKLSSSNFNNSQIELTAHGPERPINSFTAANQEKFAYTFR